MVHEPRQIGSGQTRDGKSEHRRYRNPKEKRTGMGEFNSDNLYTTMYMSPLEEME